MKSLRELITSKARKYRISLVLEENELDSYINEEVPDPEEDEAKALHKKNLVMENRIIVDYQGSPNTTGVLPQGT